jgi:hypothetical protein
MAPSSRAGKQNHPGQPTPCLFVAICCRLAASMGVPCSSIVPKTVASSAR